MYSISKPSTKLTIPQFRNWSLSGSWCRSTTYLSHCRHTQLLIGDEFYGVILPRGEYELSHMNGKPIIQLVQWNGKQIGKPIFLMAHLPPSRHATAATCRCNRKPPVKPGRIFCHLRAVLVWGTSRSWAWKIGSGFTSPLWFAWEIIFLKKKTIDSPSHGGFSVGKIP